MADILNVFSCILCRNLKEIFKAIDDGNKTLDKEELQIFMNECNFDIKYTDFIHENC